MCDRVFMGLEYLRTHVLDVHVDRFNSKDRDDSGEVSLKTLNVDEQSIEQVNLIEAMDQDETLLDKIVLDEPSSHISHDHIYHQTDHFPTPPLNINANASLRCSFAECNGLTFHRLPNLLRHTRLKHPDSLHPIHLKAFRNCRRTTQSNHVLKNVSTTRFKCSLCDDWFECLEIHVIQEHTVMEVVTGGFGEWTKTLESEEKLEGSREMHQQPEYRFTECTESTNVKPLKSSQQLIGDFASIEEHMKKVDSKENDTNDSDEESLEKTDLENNTDLNKHLMNKMDSDEEELDQPEHQQPLHELNEPTNESKLTNDKSLKSYQQTSFGIRCDANCNEELLEGIDEVEVRNEMNSDEKSIKGLADELVEPLNKLHDYLVDSDFYSQRPECQQPLNQQQEHQDIIRLTSDEFPRECGASESKSDDQLLDEMDSEETESQETVLNKAVLDENSMQSSSIQDHINLSDSSLEHQITELNIMIKIVQPIAQWMNKSSPIPIKLNLVQSNLFEQQHQGIDFNDQFQTFYANSVPKAIENERSKDNSTEIQIDNLDYHNKIYKTKDDLNIPTHLSTPLSDCIMPQSNQLSSQAISSSLNQYRDNLDQLSSNSTQSTSNPISIQSTVHLIQPQPVCQQQGHQDTVRSIPTQSEAKSSSTLPHTNLILNPSTTFSSISTHQPELNVIVFHKSTKQTSVNCLQCGRFCAHRSSFRIHCYNFHPKQSLFCEVSECGEKFETKTHLIKHYRNVHKGVNFPCAKCYNRKDLIVDHLRTYHQIDFGLPKTNLGQSNANSTQSTPNQSNPISVQSNVYLNRLQETPVCQQEHQNVVRSNAIQPEVKSNSTLQHTNLILKPSTTFSSKSTHQPNLQVIELSKSTKQTSVNCPECGKILKHKYSLAVHCYNKHPAQSPLCEVSGCGKSFETKIHLIQHYHRVHRGVNFPCAKCYYRKKLVVDHLRTYHQIDFDPPKTKLNQSNPNSTQFIANSISVQSNVQLNQPNPATHLIPTPLSDCIMPQSNPSPSQPVSSSLNQFSDNLDQPQQQPECHQQQQGHHKDLERLSSDEHPLEKEGSESKRVYQLLEKTDSGEKSKSTNPEAKNLRPFRCLHCDDSFENVDDLKNHFKVFHEVKTIVTDELSGCTVEDDHELDRHRGVHQQQPEHQIAGNNESTNDKLLKSYRQALVGTRSDCNDESIDETESVENVSNETNKSDRKSIEKMVLNEEKFHQPVDQQPIHEPTYESNSINEEPLKSYQEALVDTRCDAYFNEELLKGIDKVELNSDKKSIEVLDDELTESLNELPECSMDSYLYSQQTECQEPLHQQQELQVIIRLSSDEHPREREDTELKFDGQILKEMDSGEKWSEETDSQGTVVNKVGLDENSMQSSSIHDNLNFTACPLEHQVTELNITIEKCMKPSNQTTFDCCDCGKSFKYKSSLDNHTEQVHSKQLYHCGVSGCRKNVKNRYNLYRHYRKVHNEVNFPCGQCKVLLSKNDLMVKHLQTYHQIVVINCEQPEIPITELAKSPFYCIKCKKSFKNKQSYGKHLKSAHPKHLQTCTVSGCGKMFKSRCTLIRHCRVVHKLGINFPCDKCKVLGNRKYLMLDHLRTYHEIDLAPPTLSCLYQSSPIPIQPNLIQSNSFEQHNSTLNDSNLALNFLTSTTDSNSLLQSNLDKSTFQYLAETNPNPGQFSITSLDPSILTNSGVDQINFDEIVQSNCHFVESKDLNSHQQSETGTIQIPNLSTNTMPIEPQIIIPNFGDGQQSIISQQTQPLLYSEIFDQILHSSEQQPQRVEKQIHQIIDLDDYSIFNSIVNEDCVDYLFDSIQLGNWDYQDEIDMTNDQVNTPTQLSAPLSDCIMSLSNQLSGPPVSLSMQQFSVNFDQQSPNPTPNHTFSQMNQNPNDLNLCINLDAVSEQSSSLQDISDLMTFHSNQDQSNITQNILNSQSQHILNPSDPIQCSSVLAMNDSIDSIVNSSLAQTQISLVNKFWQARKVARRSLTVLTKYPQTEK